MIQVSCDKKGRILLSEAIRSKYGDKFVLLEAPGELVLLPVPKDPVKDLEELGKPLRHMSLREIEKMAYRQAMKEVEPLLRRRKAPARGNPGAAQK